MIVDAGYALLLIALPLAAQIRGWPPFALFAAAALVHGAMAGWHWAELARVKSLLAADTTPLHDTYYVVSPGGLSAGPAAVMAFFGLVTWLQDRLGAMRHPRITFVLFWTLHLAISATLLAPGLIWRVVPPRRYVDYPEAFQVMNSLSLAAALLGQLAVLCLLGLAVWSGIKRWRGS